MVENKIIFESLKYISSAFIIYLSISSFRDKSHSTDLSKFTFKNGLLVHPLSPKTWSMIILAQSQISDINLSQIQRSLIIWIIFTVGQIVFHSSWGVAGSILGKAFNNNIWSPAMTNDELDIINDDHQDCYINRSYSNLPTIFQIENLLYE